MALNFLTCVTYCWQVVNPVFNKLMAKCKGNGKKGKGKAYSSKSILKAAIEVQNCRKQSANNSSDSSGSPLSKNNSSSEEPPKWHHWKKGKPTEVDKVDNEIEDAEVEVVDSEWKECSTVQGDKVSAKSSSKHTAIAYQHNRELEATLRVIIVSK